MCSPYVTENVSLGSFKVSASVSKAAVSRHKQNFERIGLGSEGLVHILAAYSR